MSGGEGLSVGEKKRIGKGTEEREKGRKGNSRREEKSRRENPECNVCVRVKRLSLSPAALIQVASSLWNEENIYHTTEKRKMQNDYLEAKRLNERGI